MRVLSNEEMGNVGGGWFFLWSWCKPRTRTYCEPKPVCEPAPVCEPKPTCEPKPSCNNEPPQVP